MKEASIKDALRLFARYSRHANEVLFGVLESLKEESLSEEAGSFFGSILGLLNHNLVAGINWLNRFRHSGLSLPFLDTPALDIQYPGFGKPLHHGLKELRDHQTDVDRLFLTLTEELTEPMMGTVIVYTKPDGEEVRRVAWQALLHVFNHQTHHRGQISQILDSRGVEHDFSNLAAVL